jgi:hypothetical protein
MTGNINHIFIYSSLILIILALIIRTLPGKLKTKSIKASKLELHIGDKQMIEIPNVNGNLKYFKIVNSIKDSSKTLVISLTYDKVQGNMGYFSILQIKNSITKKLRFKSSIKRESNSNFDEPEIVILKPGESKYSFWTFKIETLVLSEFIIE